MPTFSRGCVRSGTRASPRRTDRRPFPGVFVALAAGLAAAAASSEKPVPLAPGHSPVRFVNVARDAGLTLRNVSGEVQKTTIDETVGNGICLYDVDDDGAIDIFIPNGSRGRPYPPGEAPRSALYRNKGGGAFEDITERAGVASIGYWAQGCVFGDYDPSRPVRVALRGLRRVEPSLAGSRFAEELFLQGSTRHLRTWRTPALDRPPVPQ
ncbi:MAG: hypothetical protein DMF52_11670 [Acidobacteria bacterium]|nr:MAG: hypothetical protein DMF52_11670 [Acidobacteriota bacterium]